MNGIAAGIKHALQEQAAATKEISNSAYQTAAATKEVTENAERFWVATEAARTRAQEAEAIAVTLQQKTRNLAETSWDFMTQICGAQPNGVAESEA
jgi:methyl-accepting chemotaxis protein